MFQIFWEILMDDAHASCVAPLLSASIICICIKCLGLLLLCCKGMGWDRMLSQSEVVVIEESWQVSDQR